jgi:creatinine amidohydrolase/Fe(II)-dependent formamide hydrolase-like protein
VLGDARLANMEKGQRLLDAIVKVGTELLRNVQSLPVEIKPFNLV